MFDCGQEAALASTFRSVFSNVLWESHKARFGKKYEGSIPFTRSIVNSALTLGVQEKSLFATFLHTQAGSAFAGRSWNGASAMRLTFLLAEFVNSNLNELFQSKPSLDHSLDQRDSTLVTVGRSSDHRTLPARNAWSG